MRYSPLSIVMPSTGGYLLRRTATKRCAVQTSPRFHQASNQGNGSKQMCQYWNPDGVAGKRSLELTAPRQRAANASRRADGA
jgi:hypothetical protein